MHRLPWSLKHWLSSHDLETEADRYGSANAHVPWNTVGEYPNDAPAVVEHRAATVSCACGVDRQLNEITRTIVITGVSAFWYGLTANNLADQPISDRQSGYDLSFRRRIQWIIRLNAYLYVRGNTRIT